MSAVPPELLETMAALQLDVEMKSEQGLRDCAKMSGLDIRQFVIVLLARLEHHRGDIAAYSQVEVELLLVCAATYLTQLCTTLFHEDEDA